MTKQVRIENADNSNFKVIVETWDKGHNGEPDTLAGVERLDWPTSMTSNTYVTSTRYLVVKEAAPE